MSLSMVFPRDRRATSHAKPFSPISFRPTWRLKAAMILKSSEPIEPQDANHHTMETVKRMQDLVPSIVNYYASLTDIISWKRLLKLFATTLTKAHTSSFPMTWLPTSGMYVSSWGKTTYRGYDGMNGCSLHSSPGLYQPSSRTSSTAVRSSPFVSGTQVFLNHCNIG